VSISIFTVAVTIIKQQ